MKNYPLLQKLAKSLSKGGSLLLLFQRTPVVQALLPEMNFLSSAVALDSTKVVIATVIGLGAYDSVAGATTVSQVAPSSGSSTVPVTSGTNLTGVFQIVGGGGHTPQSWSISNGSLPGGLILKNSKGKTTTLTGITTQSGNQTVTIRGWENSNFSGRSAAGTFTIQVSAPPGAAITSHPTSTSINSGSTATLTVLASGGTPLTYQWYQGSSGTTSHPVGTNSNSFTTPVLSTTTDYWVRVANDVNPNGADSNTATVTVRQPAAITTNPTPTSLNSGQTTTLSVVASGDAPLSYQWYEGASGVTTTPVGTNSSSFTTPVLRTTTGYWVKVTNVANLTGAFSTEATITVVPPETPTIYSPSPLATGVTGVNYNASLLVTGGTAPYTWTLSEGSLPEGLSLSEVGVISGTATTNGTSIFSVQVEDMNGLTDTASYSLTMSDLRISTAVLPTAVKGELFNYHLNGTGGNGDYTWALSAGTLPPGMTLSSGGVISGLPGSASESIFTVSLTDASEFSVSLELTLHVSDTYLVPVIVPITLEPVTIGTDFSYTISAQNYPTTFTVKKLPKGLKANVKTGLISGVPAVSGDFDMEVSAKNKAGSSAVVIVHLRVLPLETNLVGSFEALVDRDLTLNRNLGGMLTLTSTLNGSFSLKLIGALPNNSKSTASTIYTAKGRLAASAPQVSTTVGGQLLELTLAASTGAVTGTLGGVPVNGWRSAWNAKFKPAEAHQGYYSMALDLKDPEDIGVDAIPQGTGFATFSVSLAGTLKVVGKTADGESITSSTFLGSSGEFGVYSPLYKKQGTIQGPLSLSLEEIGPEDNRISGTMTWYKPDTVARGYPASFGPTNLLTEGGYLGPLSKRKLVFGLPDLGSVQVHFTGGGLAFSETNPNMSFTFTDKGKVVLPLVTENPGKVTIAITPVSGKVSGKFSLVETAPPLKRSNVSFLGQVVKLGDGSVKAVGYFMLPQIPGPGQKPTAAPILSGGFSLEQPIP